MNAKSLAGRRIAVSGGLGALGRVVGLSLALEGAAVVLIDRAPAVVVDGVQAVIGDADMTDVGCAAQAFERASLALGGLDGLVNVAGGFKWERFEGGSVETWDLLYALNLRTAVAASMQALPHLMRSQDPGIVNVGACAATKAGLGMGAYAASKAGVCRLTEAMAEEFKERGLRVNAVLPSIIDTPVNRADMPDAQVDRWVSPLALARVIAFLLSADAAAVTGACLPVTGKV